MKNKGEPKVGYDDEQVRVASKLSKVFIETNLKINKAILDAEDSLRKMKGEENDDNGNCSN